MPREDGDRQGGQGKLKRTFHLDHASVVALSEMQVEEFKRTGRKPDLSEIVSRAIQKLRDSMERTS